MNDAKRAFRHGFYSRRFRRQELKDLDSYQATGLNDEILMLRVAMQRVMELSDPKTLEEAIDSLDVLSISATRMARLLKVQAELGSGKDEVAQALSQALAQVMEEFKRESET